MRKEAAMPGTRQEPFHEGERRAQALAGEREEALHNGRCISDRLVPGMLPFVAAQPLVVVAARDDEGRPWAGALVGQPGLARAGPTHVDLDLRLVSHQALRSDLRAGADVGLLFIDLATRRRLRVNGTLRALDAGADRLRVDVRQAFPNCPKYIQRREPLRAGGGEPGASAGAGEPAPRPLTDWLAAADTLFVASGHPDQGLDASHRGGRPGFVQVEPDGALLVPDYAGNGMFNTLGNLLVDPRAGLLVVDFTRPRALLLTGRAEVLWSRPGADAPAGGAGRWWRFVPAASCERALPADLTWRTLDAWPRLP